MQKKLNNYAFIDSQNLNLGIRSLGWRLDHQKFRIYLKEKYSVTKAYLFIGYMAENKDMYSALQSSGFVLVFKPTLPDKDGKIKGNTDADLVLQAMIDYEKYDKAVIVTSDGDFYSLVKHLYKNKKLECVMSSYIKTCSALLKKTAREKIVFMNNLRNKLEYKEKHRKKSGVLKGVHKEKHRKRTKP